MSKIIPIGNRVIVQAKPIKNETSSGIVLPESKEKPMEGIVISVGSSDEKVKISVGDIVLYKKYSPTEVKVNGEEYLILEIDDVLAKIEK